MQKKIVAVTKAFHGHLKLDLEDGSSRMVFRGDHELHAPQVGDLWPPEDHEHTFSGALRKKA